MKYLLSVSNAADVRTIVTHDLEELGIRFDLKKDQETSTNFRKSRSRENSLVSIKIDFISKDELIS